MNRRSFFKACGGAVVGAVLLPSKSLANKENKTRGFTKKIRIVRAGREGGIEYADYVLQAEPTPMEEGNHKQAFVD